MNISDWPWIKGLTRLLTAPRREPARQPERIAAMQLHIVLPAKFGVIVVVLYYLFQSGWFEPQSERKVVAETLQTFIFFVYVIGNLIAAGLFAAWRRFPADIFQWVVFTLGLLDGLFIAGLTFITG